ncbi:FCP1-like domain, HAD-like domain protein [Artemisia annua]|uniref:FCP1-like domain, HAD-like domain protein n=1 Tax=Artemisia annua TaxID=35608 RepID=A0A2U1KEI7_ARTAN|nr:FCP1-like domain, HAD-like domain protein [Artemisia annua]
MVRNSSKALASPKVSKTKKKIQEDVDNQENKVSQIITSSARKQKPDLGCGLSSEVSAIYQCMKDSKLECVDEDDHDHTSSDAQVEDDECEEFDEFDPYFFIKNLPELATVVPTFRPLLLPKRTRSCPLTTLVLDLDEVARLSSLLTGQTDMGLRCAGFGWVEMLTLYSSF